MRRLLTRARRATQRDPPAVPPAPATGRSKSWNWMIEPSAVEGKLGKLIVRTGPAPRDRSEADTLPVGGRAAGKNTSAPVRNGRPENAGSGWLRSVRPSRPRSKKNRPLTCFEIGHITGGH